MEEDQKKESFVVNDRRRFDSDGNERAQNPANSGNVRVEGALKNQPTDTATITNTSTVNEGAPNMAGEVPAEIEFSSFVMSLATQALVQLGDMQPPPGLEMPVDPDAARQTIDILSMLQQKTKGNLNPNETRLMEDILHNLRVSFVRHAK